MYSQQLLRINHDEWLRHAETQRLIKQAKAVSRGSAPRARHGRRPLGGLALRSPLRHA